MRVCIPLTTDSFAKENVGPVDDAVETRVPTDWLLVGTSRFVWLNSTVEREEFPSVEPANWFTSPLEATGSDVGWVGRIGGQHGQGSPRWI